MSKETIVKSPSGRVKRASLDKRNRLTVQNKDPEFHYRFVNDEEGRVQEFIDMGYEPVQADKVKIGDKRVTNTSPEGSVAQISVGRGVKGVLMRIPKEWFEQDQAAKMREVDSTEAAMKQEAIKDRYGKYETEFK